MQKSRHFPKSKTIYTRLLLKKNDTLHNAILVKILIFAFMYIYYIYKKPNTSKKKDNLRFF